jgi:hypothetical protein
MHGWETLNELMCLHYSTIFHYSFSLQKPEETFQHVLVVDTKPCTINSEKFKGFSFINHDV